MIAGIGASLVNQDHANAHDTSINEIQSEEKKLAKSAGSKKVIIGGAGIGGMCCGYELMKKGHEVVVLEASGRHGGHVYTAHDGLSDQLYGDYGQEHITKPGYDKYWEYIQEFNLTALPYPRRKNVLRRIKGKFYTEEMLRDTQVLGKFGFNEKEIKFLSDNPWWDLKSLYTRHYLDKFKNEYEPFGVGYDDLDKIPMASLYKKDGASDFALTQLNGNNSSALFDLWYSAILKFRKVPEWPPEVYRLKGGNQMLPNSFAKKLAGRVWLNSPITEISHNDSGVTIKYRQHNEDKEISGDFFVNCISLTQFRNIPIRPALSAAKKYICDTVTYDSYQRFVFQASSKFWEADNVSINLELDHPDLWATWQSAEEVETHRVIVLGTGPGGVSPQRALAAFREVYPGKGKDSIEQAVSKDWTKDSFAPSCERLPFPIGQLHQYWPHIMEPEGRIHFAGAYADNLNWGTEAATRSANRVANAIDKA